MHPWAPAPLGCPSIPRLCLGQWRDASRLPPPGGLGMGMRSWTPFAATNCDRKQLCDPSPVLTVVCHNRGGMTGVDLAPLSTAWLLVGVQ